MSENKEEKDRSYIHAEFENKDHANPNINIANVTPNQIMALVGYLEAYAKSFYSAQIAQSIQQRRDQELSVPKPKIEMP